MEKPGPSSRNPERQVPNKRKRYSSKFLYFRIETILNERRKKYDAEKYNARFSF